MVTEAPNNNELINTDPIELITDLYDGTSENINDQAFAIAILYYLTDFSKKYETKTITNIERNYQTDLDKLQDKLINENRKGLEELFNKQSEATMKEYNIPESKYSKVTNPNTAQEVINTTQSTIEAMIQQMKSDIKTRLLVWKEDTAKDNKSFDINANLNRAARRLKDTIRYGTSRVKQKAQRGIQKFVHQPETLYVWVNNGPAPCGWCILQSEKAPQVMDDWEMDHPNGYCSLEPTGEYDFSKQYKELMGIS